MFFLRFSKRLFPGVTLGAVVRPSFPRFATPAPSRPRVPQDVVESITALELAGRRLAAANAALVARNDALVGALRRIASDPYGPYGVIARAALAAAEAA